MKTVQLPYWFRSVIFASLLLLVTACSPRQAVLWPMQVKPIQGNIADTAAVQMAMSNFLEAWVEEDYAAMYGFLSNLSKDAHSLDDFTRVYQNFADTITLKSIEPRILSALAEGNYGEVAYRVDFDTLLIGSLKREMVASMVREFDGWRVQWEQKLIMPELINGNRLELSTQTPSRGVILDRAGAPLAGYERAIAIGLVPRDLREDQIDQVFLTLAELSFYDAETLERIVENTPPDWYLPVVTLTKEAVEPYIEILRNLSGVRIDEFRSRYYVDGGVAPHALGYMLFISEEQLPYYSRLGYPPDARVGAAGLEASFEIELAGKYGASLFLLNQAGEVQSLLASGDSEPGQSITTTIDKKLQMLLQASLGDFRGAVVVMEVDTGKVLAIVSNPHFDPNAFDLTGNDRGLLDSYFSNPDQPLFNRTTYGQYPLGSVFKVISMSAAMESGLFKQNSTFLCGHSMLVCNSVTLYDWTYNSGAAASGELNLKEGLMRSCNPWFYKIGESLFLNDMDGFLSEMAYEFGLGAETGIEIGEAAGNIPKTAETCVNSAQISIGQGEVLVTPMQVASVFSALANGGTLYRPALVTKIGPKSGSETYVMQPEILGKLPVSDETLTAVQEGLQMVVENTRGTGYWTLEDLDIPVSGKTGTAQTHSGTSHAWFAGYSRAHQEDRPDIAVAVLIENSGEGSVMAAPVFRRAISLYFSDGEDPGGVMPWEAEPYWPY